MWNKLKNIGPGALVAAAFIGPGTMTSMTIAGGKFGFALIWVVIFATLATIALQEMTARIAYVTGYSFATAIRKKFYGRTVFYILVLLIISGVFVGNSAYEAGNLSGTILFAQPISNYLSTEIDFILIAVALLVFALLYFGNYKHIERFLIGIVVLLSIVFIGAAVLLKPDPSEIIASIVSPSIPENGFTLAIALLGTTIVPYNLFLHSTSVINKMKVQEAMTLSDIQWDTRLSIGVGGLISIAILLCAAVVLKGENQDIDSFTQLAKPLQSALGEKAIVLLGIGFVAAGLSSSITAPLAASYATTETLGWEPDSKSWRFRLVWMIVLLAGFMFAYTNSKPINVIIFAQIVNGLLLPTLAVLLVFMMNDEDLLGDYTNSFIQNIFALLVILVSVVLSLKSAYQLLNLTG